MRKLLTTTAMILALGAAATPALADGYNGNHNGPAPRGPAAEHNAPAPKGPAFEHSAPAPQAPAFRHDAKFDRDMNAWEREWRPVKVDVRFFGHRTLTRAQVLRSLEAQGYYRVYELTPARFGSWRAVAFYRGHQIVLRVDQYTGRVISARYI